ncbi:MAG: phosphohistidine phosphatase SixA [Idiomarina sp.]|uniref:phosphohistidine phosphatase SixA n=1 Tax=Idiomarina sp. TaxID=1874361 RepID=UPI000C5DF1DA|nr:phosphohistidine phosphatase SixA [Idiomarina sp.]MBT42374.1 phosphohistidine phosphatase SixA [Idiomarina sp.]
MRLYIMRHGHAVLPLSASADSDRRLTPEGEQEVATTSQWLAEQAGELDACLISPYIRAQQTGTVAMGRIKTRQCNNLHELTPDSEPSLALAAIAAEIEANDYQQVLVVSHMPLVSYLVHEIDRNKQPPIFPTAAIAVMEFDPHTQRGQFEQLMVAERCAG